MCTANIGLFLYISEQISYCVILRNVNSFTTAMITHIMSRNDLWTVGKSAPFGQNSTLYAYA